MALETLFARPDLHCTPLNKVTLHRIIRFLSASLQIHFLDFIIHRGNRWIFARSSFILRPHEA